MDHPKALAWVLEQVQVQQVQVLAPWEQALLRQTDRPTVLAWVLLELGQQVRAPWEPALLRQMDLPPALA
jgi:hypothetical protein